MNKHCFKMIILLSTFLMIVFFSASGYSATDEEVKKAILGGKRYLFSTQKQAQFTDGNGGYWEDNKIENQKDNLAVTAFAVAALLQTGVSKEQNYIKDGINYIKHFVQKDGGIYDPNSSKPSSDDNNYTYTNAAALIALSLYADQGDEYKKIVQNALQYVLSKQNTEVNYPAITTDHPSYGGWPYCQEVTDEEAFNADLSNTQLACTGIWYASHYLGIDITQEGWTQALLKYLQRSHGWYDASKGQTWNDQEWVRNPDKNNPWVDGAFSYSTEYEDFYPGGSMTAAGISCLTMIGKERDPMVDIALEWFTHNYTWERNPGSCYDDSNGIDTYYYFIFSMSRALTGIMDSQNFMNPNDWVHDLKNALLKKMHTVTSDSNIKYWEGTGWHDGGDILATSWVLMSLGTADPGTEAIEKILPQVSGLGNPIQGTVILHTQGGVTISDAQRVSIAAATKDPNVQLPLGGFSFTLKNLVPGVTTLLFITVPANAFDQNDSNSFVNENGKIKGNLFWYKIKNGKWEKLSGIPIDIDANTATIKVTLKDGGPEDEDGNPYNGVIVEPGAPGIEPFPITHLETQAGGGGGCFISIGTYKFTILFTTFIILFSIIVLFLYFTKVRKKEKRLF